MNYFIKTISLMVSIMVFSLGTIKSNAQQTPSFGEYNYNPYLVNAAYAGLAPNAEVTLGHSGFFNQFEGSPRSFAMTLHGPINRQKMGLGIGFVRDEIGVTTSTSGFATYAYKIFFDTKNNRPYWQVYSPNTLSFAISAGLNQFQDNLLELGIMGDPNFSQNINASVPTIGAGILLNLQNLYVGLSAPNLLGDALATDDNLDLSTAYYGYLGYRFYTNQFEELMIKPNALIKMENGAPLQIDLNLALSFKNRFEVGAGYRTNTSFNILGGIYLLKNIRAIYHYNLATNDSPLGNTHGLVITYRFGDGFYSN
jgi:type IX secretion system PorP/SprF family membrane protein